MLLSLVQCFPNSQCCELCLKYNVDPLILDIDFLLAELSPYSYPLTDIHRIACV